MKDGVCDGRSAVLHQQQHRADEYNERGDQNPELQQSTNDLLDCMITHSRGWIGHSEPVKPLYNISAAMTMTTPVKT